MSIIAKVVSVDFKTRVITVEAYSETHRVFKSPMVIKGLICNAKDTLHAAQKNRELITKALQKELKAFTKPIWGGLTVQICVWLGG